MKIHKVVISFVCFLLIFIFVVTCVLAIRENNDDDSSDTDIFGVSYDTYEADIATANAKYDSDDLISIDSDGETDINLDNYTSDVNITQGGTYRLTGSLEGASVIVNVVSEENVVIILDNVKIKASTKPAIYIKEA